MGYENLLLMSILGAWSDVTPDSDDFLNGRLEYFFDFVFIFICCFVAVPRNEDDSVYILEEMWIPGGSFAISGRWVSEIGERILLLTAYEGIWLFTIRDSTISIK